jgi:protease secretion system membrane fusion protein
MWILLLGVGVFVLGAVSVPLEQGVAAIGTVVVDTKRKIVQPMIGGLIKEVNAKEGQQVEAGQELIVLDNTDIKSELEVHELRLFALRIARSRLDAERLNSRSINFHPDDLTKASGRPELERQIDTQIELLRSRIRAKNANLKIHEEQKSTHKGLIRSASLLENSLNEQVSLLQKELDGVTALVSEQYAPMNRLLELRRQIASLRAQAIEIESAKLRSHQVIAELEQRDQLLNSETTRDIEQQLSQVQPEIKTLSEKILNLRIQLERSTVRSPVDGQIIGLATQTVGGVVSPGMRIADVVPLDETLVIESRIETHLIDKVRINNMVDIRLSGFARTPQLVVPGLIISISSDTVNDPGLPSSPPYYLARVRVTEDGLAELGSRVLQPGMPVDVVYKTGKRTLFDYIFSPLTRRLALSLKEE